MKVLQINVDATNGSNGGIARSIGDLIVSKGWKSYIAYGRNSIPSRTSEILRVGNNFDVFIHGVQSRLFDNHGLASKIITKKFIKRIKYINPDIIHLHNIHGYYINYKILFDFLKQIKVPVVWTLHDCWSFTGHCAHFVYINCEKWKKECYNCPLIRNYPRSLFIDNSQSNFNTKKTLFCSLDNLTIVPVSTWLSNFLPDSFLSSYPINVIHNGVDINIFKPINSDIRLKYNISKSKKIILGVCSRWTNSKGLQEFIKLSSEPALAVVMVGVDDSLRDKLPKSIIAIERTNSQEELANLYSGADVFVNPTYADTFPTVNLEALACGTPVVTYKTGGSPESISSDCGVVVQCGDYDALKAAIYSVTVDKLLYSKKCRTRAVNFYDKDKCFEKYFDLYNKIILK